ncbi:hypothetical protein C0J45_16273 [Silurus meridionalis]|nr:hypothetical protein C0J45_16273 [Silurus meridionalis]
MRSPRRRNFTWKKYINDWEQISPESEQYKDRFQLVNDHSSGNLSLLISHLTVEDEGDYRCGTQSETRVIRLTVEEAPKRPSPSTTTIQTTAKPESPDLKTIIIISSGVVVVLLLMMILGGVKYRKHRRQRREQMSEGQTVQRTQQQKQDDVMYSTVVHSDTHRAARPPVALGDTAVYASIKTN